MLCLLPLQTRAQGKDSPDHPVETPPPCKIVLIPQVEALSQFHALIKRFQTEFEPQLPEPLLANLQLLGTLPKNSPIVEKSSRAIEAAVYTLMGKEPPKRFRAGLVVMLAEFYGVEFNRLLPAARAIEYLHAASLIPDDIEDIPEDTPDELALRRGQLVCHRKFGRGTAGLASDSLISTAFKQIQKLAQNGFSDARVREVTEYMTDAVNQLVLGQQLDLHPPTQIDLEAKNLMTYLKTGVGLEAPLVAGALLLGIPEEEKALWAQIGRDMGTVFQAVDDVMDVTRSAKDTGKTTGVDQANQTPTYVGLLGIEKTQDLIQSLATKLRSDLVQVSTLARARGLPAKPDLLLGAIEFLILRRK